MKEKQNFKSKKIGQIFTPRYIVEEMLDCVKYYGNDILEKHIIDNSCGDGAFLKVVVSRYCRESILQGKMLADIKSELELYIHGIDTDEDAYLKCWNNLSNVAEEFGIFGVKWDLYNQNSLSMNDFDGKMDYVVGNPPYVRVHNLDATYNEVKQYEFANGGMTDLYLAFFELGFKMMNDNGKLCYITPSSWLNSLAATNMRLYIMRKLNLVSLIDLGHFQAFEKATTYTLISIFENQKNDDKFDYYTFNGNTHKKEFVDRISINDCYADSYFYLSDSSHLQMIKDIKSKKTQKYVSVKNGFATLADNVFIGENIPETEITIRILKASTGQWYNCFYPYDKRGKLLPPDKALANPNVKKHFITHKNDLLKNRPDYPTFYEYGRTQALQDVWREKIAINTLIRTEKDLKIEKVKCGEGIYSGLYIISDYNISFDDIKSILQTPEFAMYVSILKKYKSGGYYTFNSRDVEQYINYFITYKSSKKYDDKRRLFE